MIAIRVFVIVPAQDKRKDNKDSFLIQYIDVPGDACNLGFGGEILERIDEELIIQGSNKYLRFGDHNVDNLVQAYTLLSLFTFWHDITEQRLIQKP